MALHRELIERLVVDHELGELGEDTSALLNAYLASDANAFALASEISQTVAAARSAMTDPMTSAEAPLPPLNFAGLARATATREDDEQLPRLAPSARSGRRPAHRPWQWVGFAAAAAIAIVASFGYWPTLRVFTETELNRVRNDRDPFIAVSSSLITAPGSTEGFWQIRRSHRNSTTSGYMSSLKVRWTGPLDRPQIGESL